MVPTLENLTSQYDILKSITHSLSKPDLDDLAATCRSIHNNIHPNPNVYRALVFATAPCDGASGKAWFHDVTEMLGPGIRIHSQDEFVDKWICKTASGDLAASKQCQHCGISVCEGCRVHMVYDDTLHAATTASGGFQITVDPDIHPDETEARRQKAGVVHGLLFYPTRHVHYCDKEECDLSVFEKLSTHIKQNDEEDTDWDCKCVVGAVKREAAKGIGAWTCVPCFKEKCRPVPHECSECGEAIDGVGTAWMDGGTECRWCGGDVIDGERMVPWYLLP